MGVFLDQYLLVLAWAGVCPTVFSSQAGRLTATQSKIQQHLNVQANITDHLLVGYDKRFIPTLPDTPLKVKLEFEISDVLRLNEQEMECELIIYIRQKWIDFRLSWNDTHLNNLPVHPIKKIKVREHLLDEIWLPDIRISNLKEMNQFEKFGGINMNIHPNGRVYYSQLALVKIHCPMDLHNYPMDQQVCFLNFSSYAYPKSLLTFVLQKKKVRPVNLPHFDFVKAEECTVNEDKLKVKRVSIALIFNRRSGNYIVHIYIPSLSLVMLSWLSFLMSPTDIANRLALVTTMLVSMVFLHSEMNTSLPPVSYAKASDWFVLVSFGFILLTLLESSLVYRTSTSKSRMTRMVSYQTLLHLCFERKQGEMSAPDNQDEEASTGRSFKRNTSREELSSLSVFTDKLSLFLFPFMYAGFNFFYWYHYM